jgi:hypothetical protein
LQLLNSFVTGFVTGLPVGGKQEAKRHEQPIFEPHHVTLQGLHGAPNFRRFQLPYRVREVFILPRQNRREYRRKTASDGT